MVRARRAAGKVEREKAGEVEAGIVSSFFWLERGVGICFGLDSSNGWKTLKCLGWVEIKLCFDF